MSLPKHITNEQTGIHYTLHGDYYLPGRLTDASRAVNWFVVPRVRWTMKGCDEQEEIGRVATAPSEANRPYF